VRSTRDLADSEWASEWGAVVDVGGRSGGTVLMPGAPWKFSGSALSPPGQPSFQGEHNVEVFSERQVPAQRLADLRKRKILLSRRDPVGAFE
jgi:CoA:oxalate CoA-transferase